MVTSQPNNEMLHLSEFKAFADDNFNVVKIEKIVGDRVENNSVIGENACYQHFLLFPQCFPTASFSGLLKVGIVWKNT